MRILILTQYFPPETGAPQNRLYSLAINLVRHGCDVSVLTAMPNYPKMEVSPGYKSRVYVKEVENGLSIFRSWIFVKKHKGIGTRLLNYFSFVFSATLTGLLKAGRQDIIICESPPLFLAITALILKRAKKARLVFNVSDLWPESVEKLGIMSNRALLKTAYKLESRVYKKSSLVSGQTQGIINNIKSRFPDARTFWLRNGIDFEQFNTNAEGVSFRKLMSIKNTDFVVLYAGVFGHAQGLETVLEAAEQTRSMADVKYFLIGDGPEKERLIQLARAKRLENIEFLPNRPQDEIPEIIAACDAYLVPLKKNNLFLGAIPSKLFEPLAMGKPIILGVDGEARELFIEKGKCGLYSEPGSASELVKCINVLYSDKDLAAELGRNGLEYVRRNFDRRVIADEFYDALITVNNG